MQKKKLFFNIGHTRNEERQVAKLNVNGLVIHEQIKDHIIVLQNSLLLSDRRCDTVPIHSPVPQKT
jgi:hypothetical protein